MYQPEPKRVKRVGVVGLGNTGQQWVVLFQRCGLEVVGYDPGGLSFSPLTSEGTFTMAPDLASTVAEVDFVQECGPPALIAKLQLLKWLDAVTPEGVIIASSTANCAMTTLQQDLVHPERCVVGHLWADNSAFVEVVGGQKTAPTAIDWVMAFYAVLGRQPLQINNESPGFLTSRLQGAVWREAVEVVAKGLTTVKEIDAVMTYGSTRR